MPFRTTDLSFYIVKMTPKDGRKEVVHSVWTDSEKAETLASRYNHKRSPVSCRVEVATPEEVCAYWGVSESQQQPEKQG